MTQRNDDARTVKKSKFRIGGRDDLIFLLHERGDSFQEIANVFRLSALEVEEVIKQCKVRKNIVTD